MSLCLDYPSKKGLLSIYIYILMIMPIESLGSE
jgi:hypothetical protein